MFSPSATSSGGGERHEHPAQRNRRRARIFGKSVAKAKVGSGLGKNIVAALAKSLNAVVKTASTASGFSVTIREESPSP